MSSKSCSDDVTNQRNVFRDLALREIDLLNQRTSIFLVYNSIMVAGLALGNLNWAVKLIITSSGLISNIIWLYIGRRGFALENWAWDRVKKMEEQAEVDHKIYTKWIYQRKKTRSKLAGKSSFYIGTLLPILWALTWLGVFVISIIAVVLKQPQITK